MRPNRWCACLTAASTAPLSPTSSVRGRSRSPYFSFNLSSEPMLRAAAATLSPRANAASVQTNPKPLDAPVMNQALREVDLGMEFCPPKRYLETSGGCSASQRYIRRILRLQEAALSKSDTIARSPRADAQRNRERLLATALKMFSSSEGEVTLSAVAERAGVGIGTLYRHFPTRDALVEAVYRHEVERLSDAAPAL